MASHMNSVAGRWGRVRSILLHEFREMLPPTIFFFVGFNLILFSKRLFLADYLIQFSGFMLATTSALVVGKTVLVANMIPFLRRFDHGPLHKADSLQDHCLHASGLRGAPAGAARSPPLPGQRTERQPGRDSGQLPMGPLHRRADVGIRAVSRLCHGDPGQQPLQRWRAVQDFFYPAIVEDSSRPGARASLGMSAPAASARSSRASQSAGLAPAS
jgi:hypothetical protein